MRTKPCLPSITEAEFQRQVLQLARINGWRSAHFRPAKTARGWRTPCQGDAKGFPDLVLVKPGRPGRLLFVELKRLGAWLTGEQKDWIHALEDAGAQVFVWRPSDWPEIEKELSR